MIFILHGEDATEIVEEGKIAHKTDNLENGDFGSNELPDSHKVIRSFKERWNHSLYVIFDPLSELFFKFIHNGANENFMRVFIVKIYWQSVSKEKIFPIVI